VAEGNVVTSLAGISRKTFIVGLIIAIAASSSLSTVITTQWARGPEGPKGDKGDTGLQGIQGLQGPQGPPWVFAISTADDIVGPTEPISYIDVKDMVVTLAANETSDLLILVSVEALSSWDEHVYIRALVNGEIAQPGEVWLTPTVQDATSGDSYLVGWACYAYNFRAPSVEPGTHTIKIQWRVSSGESFIGVRTLTVIALPT